MAISDKIVLDNPANNFATLNPLGEGLTGTLAEGNLKYTTGNVHSSTRGNFYVSSGKWYWEVYIVNITVGTHVGISSIDEVVSLTSLGNGSTNGNVGNWQKNNAIDYYSANGYLFYNNTNSGSWGNTFAAGDIISVYLNLDANQLSFYKNNTLQASAIDLTSSTYNLGTLTFTSRFDDGGNSTGGDVFVINHGQDSSFAANKTDSAGPYTDANGIGEFYYQPPAGALALCTQNIPEPAISLAQGDSPNKHFIALMWYGTSSSTISIPKYDTKGPDEDSNQVTSNIAFNPDLVWVKDRGNSSNHVLFDSVRGFGKNTLYTNSTNAETIDENGHVSSVTSNKVNFASGSSGKTNWNSVGGSSNNYAIGWFWRAGGPPASDGVAMVDGTATTTAALKNAASATITPTRMSVNTTAGFSIIKWVGNNTNNATIPHGLTKTPDFVLLKNTSDSVNWLVKLNPNTIPAVSNEQQYLYLNLTNPFGTNTGEETQLTSNTIKFVGTNLNPSNGSGDNMIAYCWHSVPGYSSFGSYTANGSTDGPFIYTGFRPAWVMIKNTNDSSNYSSWMIVDSTRSAFNTAGGGNCLWANRNSSEGYRGNGSAVVGNNDWLDIDLVSNGFKIRGGGHNTETNDAYSSAKVYIYMAFASQSINFSPAR